MTRLSRTSDPGPRACEVAAVALDATVEGSTIRIQSLDATDTPETLIRLRESEMTVSLFAQVGSLVVLTGSAGLSMFRDRPSDLGRLVEMCQGMQSTTEWRERTSNKRFVGAHRFSLAYLSGRWTDLSSEHGQFVAVGLCGERLFALRRELDGTFRELYVARPTVLDAPLEWHPLGRVPFGMVAMLDASRFVGTPNGARAVIRMRGEDGDTSHCLLSIEGDDLIWSEPFKCPRSILRVRNDGFLTYETTTGGFALSHLSRNDVSIQLYAYYLAATAR